MRDMIGGALVVSFLVITTICLDLFTAAVVDAYIPVANFCGDPPHVMHAQTNLMQNQKHYVFKVGEIATYSCVMGYQKVSGMEQIQCRSYGERKQPQWDADTLKCEIVKCNDPGIVANSTRTVSSNFNFNTNVIYECVRGFRMIGVPFLTCKANGVWNREKPLCQLKRCPELDQLENGRIVYSDSERITDSKAEYLCDQGYKINTIHTVRYCRQDDSWSPLSDLNDTFPKCELVTCEAPVRPHSGIRVIPPRPRNGGNFKPEDTIIYSCDTNKLIVASAKCLPDGRWSRGAPHCPSYDINCPPIADFQHGFYNATNSAAKDSLNFKTSTKIRFYCNENYILDGTSILTCLANGSWNGTAPKCAFNKAIVQSSSSQLTILISAISVLIIAVFFITCFLVCRWRQQKMQRRRWQQYFGHYNHRQSKTNIMLNTSEMKCFRQTPPKQTVPVTDL